MEVITSFFTTLYESLGNPDYVVPIVNMQLRDFLFSVFVLSVVVTFIGIIIGHSHKVKGGEK